MIMYVEDVIEVAEAFHVAIDDAPMRRGQSQPVPHLSAPHVVRDNVILREWWDREVYAARGIER